MAERTRKIDGVPLASDEHFSIMDEVNGDVQKVKAIIAKMYETSLRMVADMDAGNRPAAIIKAGSVIEGLELLKTIWQV